MTAKKTASPGQPDAADTGDPPPASEFERFQNLTRKLLNVPKREIDERRNGKA